MRTLIIAPHPDDEALGCGGYIAQQIAHGNQVDVLFLTSGEHGCPGMDVDQARRTRQAEAIAVSRVLGHEIIGFWDYPDGQLLYSREIRDRVVDLINGLEPDRVMVTHERESHQDHRNAGIIIREAMGLVAGKPEYLGYEVWTPQQRADRVLDVTNYMAIKHRAIAEYKSQISRVRFDQAAEALAHFRGIMNGKCEYAETYGRIRKGGELFMKISVALLTWAPNVNSPRHEYAKRTLTSLLEKLDPGDNVLQFHIADDGSGPDHVETLVKLCRDHGYEPSVTNSERGGYGRSYNLMMQTLHNMSDVILPVEDDWELTRPLKLDNPARALEISNGTIKCIRMGYLGFTQALRGQVVSFANQLFLLLDPDSPEPHVFAGHPRLETVEFERDVGVWPENIPAGQTEWEVTHRWEARQGVAWPLDLGIPASQDWGTLFAHIGSESANGVMPGELTA